MAPGWVNRDGADFTAVELFPDVEVADFGQAYGAAVFHFLAHLVADVGPGCLGLVFVDAVSLQPRILRSSLLLDLVTTNDPKLVSATYGMTREAVTASLADRIDPIRLGELVKLQPRNRAHDRLNMGALAKSWLRVLGGGQRG